MKTIVLMPVYRAARFWDQVACKLYRMDPQPDKWIFCENNSPDDTVHKLARFKRPHELIRFWVRRDASLLLESPYDLVAIARQFLLQRARQLDSDWAVFIDSDIEVVSSDLLDSLTSHEVDIVGGPYLRWYAHPPARLLGCVFQLPYGLKMNGSGQLLKAPRMMWDTRMVAVGGGCMALSRRILQDRRLNFYPARHPELGFESSEDYGYCHAAGRLGYVVGLDASVKLRHSNMLALSNHKPWTVDENGKMPAFEY